MPIHDWTRVNDGTFHAFHTLWLGEIMKALNDGLLPAGYYALAEQIASRMQTDVLALRVPRNQQNPTATSGGLAVAEAPPAVRTARPDPGRRPRQRGRQGRHLVVRHSSGHEVVALIEIVSPSNKDRRDSVRDFTDKAVRTLHAGVQLMLLDLQPPSRFDPLGMHGAIWAHFDTQPVEMQPDFPLMLASYATTDPDPTAYLEPTAVGRDLIDMPLFLNPERYINAPLQATYDRAYRGMPAFWRDVVEGREESPVTG